MICLKCGGSEWTGPKFLALKGVAPTGWPMFGTTTTPDTCALLFQCACCGFARFQKTVDNGGPVAAPLPKEAQRVRDTP